MFTVIDKLKTFWKTLPKCFAVFSEATQTLFVRPVSQTPAHQQWTFQALVLGFNKSYILLTFDDGYKSQKFFADKILNKHNIKSIVFVITNFLNIDDQKEAKNFVLNNIDTNIDKDKLRYDEVNNMNFEDILNLRSNNH